MKFFLISLLVLASAYAQAEIESAYTSVDTKDCITISSSEFDHDAEIDYLHQECPAFGGYQVSISGGDIRYSLKLSYQGKEIETTQLASFHDMGSSKIEWRYERDDEDWHSVIRYKALIYRLNFTTYDKDGNPGSEDMLVVVRLNKQNSCVIGTIAQSKDMNIKARQLADNKSVTCL